MELWSNTPTTVYIDYYLCHRTVKGNMIFFKIKIYKVFRFFFVKVMKVIYSNRVDRKHKSNCVERVLFLNSLNHK